MSQEDPADEDFTHGLQMIFAARRCRSWVGDELMKARLAGFADSYRVRGTILMTCAAQPIRANRTATDAQAGGARPARSPNED